MTPATSDRQPGDRRAVIVCLISALALSGLTFWLTHDWGLPLTDEGWNWYASQRTLLGEVAWRDFQAYDPGRYYWNAAWMLWLGSGLSAYRLAVGAASAFGLFCALLIARRINPAPLMIAVLAVLLALGVGVGFEAAIGAVGMLAALRLVERPTGLRHMLAGISVGLAGFIGRNLGVYIGAASLAIILWFWVKTERRQIPLRLAQWGGGVVLGYAPAWLMMIFIPGFASSLLESIVFLFRLGHLSLPLPIPWPWNVQPGAFALDALNSTMLSVCLIALPVFYLSWIVSAARAAPQTLSRNAVGAVCSVYGAAYLHYVFGRADALHLAAGLYPFMIGAWDALPRWLASIRSKRLVRASTVAVLMLAAAGTAMPGPLGRFIAPDQFVIRVVGTDPIWVDKRQVASLDTLTGEIMPRIRADEGLLVAPYLPGIYPIVGRKAPVWETYMFWPAFPEDERNMIRDLDHNRVNWAIISNVALDNLSDRRLSVTHPLLWAYLQQNFEPLDPPVVIFEEYEVLRRVGR